jgi:putative ABC transport system permease protein
VQRWWGQWRVALRLARRDAWHGKGRSILVLLLVGLPVCAVAVVDISARQIQASTTPAADALNRLGDTADGILSPQASRPVSQSLFGDSVDSSGVGPAPTVASLQAALPAGTRLVPPLGQSNGLILQAGEWGVPGNLAVGDVSDPVLAGFWHLTAGTFPTAKGQVTLDPATARRLHVDVGGTLEVSGVRDQAQLRRTFTVVGLATADPMTGANGLVGPGELPTLQDTGPTSGLQPIYYLDSAAPLTWADVRRANAAGAFVISRGVVEDPPTFCPYSLLCYDDGPAPGAEQAVEELTPNEAADQARTAALGAVVVVLVVLQIALLAGPAFAVQLRRRQRELGLIGASGGGTPVLRRTVLASGVVLGVTASVGGAVLAWLIVLVAGRVLHVGALAIDGRPVQGWPPLPLEVLGVVAVGVLAAVSAALVPALAAGKGEVVDTLRGRRPLAPVRNRFPVLGFVMGGAGLAVMAYGVMQVDSLVLGVGVIVAQLGVVVLMPWLVVQTGRLGRHLSLSPRLAVRDAGRHRMRTAAAACAIAAASAAAVGVSAAVGSAATYYSTTDVATLPGVSGLSVGALEVDDAGRPVASDASVQDDVRRTVLAADPAARTAFLATVVPTGHPEFALTYNGDVACGEEALQPYLANGRPDPTYVAPCSGRIADSYLGITGAVAEISPEDVALVLGPGAPLDDVRAALEAGKAVVLQPNAVQDGSVLLRASVSDRDTGEVASSASVQVPAIEVLRGALPTTVLVSAATLARPEVAKVLQASPYGVLLAQPSEPDSADRPTFQDRLQLELYRSGVPVAINESYTATDGVVLVLLVGGAVTAFLALLAGLMVTALALADGRADHATLAAVGAPPGARRRIAAATAGYVALLGCVVGAVSGLLGSYVLVPLVNRGSGGTWEMPWAMLAIVLVAVPLMTSAVAWLTTRSDVLLTRRTDT